DKRYLNVSVQMSLGLYAAFQERGNFVCVCSNREGHNGFVCVMWRPALCLRQGVTQSGDHQPQHQRYTPPLKRKFLARIFGKLDKALSQPEGIKAWPGQSFQQLRAEVP